MRTLLSRLLDLMFRRRREERLSEEVQTHLDLLAADYEAKGLSRRDAQLAARKAFGGVEQIKAVYRDQRGFRPMADLSQDIRHALRLIVRDRWFTAATVVALALGIGVSSTMLTILYSMNFRGLPFDGAAALVRISGEPVRGLATQVPFGVFEAWRSSARSVMAMSAEVDASINLGDDVHATDQFAGSYLSHNTFGLLRERPLLGRDFSPDDDRDGAAPVVILGHRLWTERYGADPSIVGRVVRINGQPATVIGVMPDGFRYPVDQQVWLPLAAMPGMAVTERERRPVRILGRLADGVSPAQAQAELATIAASDNMLPDGSRTRRTIVISLNEAYLGSVVQPVPMMLLAAVLVVLVMACSHAASLLLARSTARTHELSMRAALGASRGRMVRQLLVESVITAFAAGAIGIVMAAAGARAFANEVATFGLPYWTRFTFDGPIVAVIVALCTGTGIAFGLLPALKMSRTNLAELMNQGGRAGISGAASQRLTGALLIGELAVTVILLSAAASLVRSADGVYQSDQIIDVANIWDFGVALPSATYASVEQRRAFYRALDARLTGSTGMASAAIASAPPFNARDSRGVFLDGEASTGEPTRVARLVAIGDRYFDTLGLRMVRGSALDELSPSARGTSALVNQGFADRFLGGADPIGRDVLLVNERAPGTPQRVTIVGIAPPLRQQVASASSAPVVYVPHDTVAGATASIIVRGLPDQFADVIRQHVRAIDPDLPVFNLKSLERVSYMSRWIPRITSTGLSIVAAIALILSALGLYALTAFAAAQRTREVGVRMALGARRGQVAWLFVRRALAQVSIGLAIGLAGAVAMGTVLQSVLIDVRANDPWMLAAVCLVLVAITLAATLLPARWAARLDPVTALRQE